MISWIKGEPVDSWQINNKFFILINCHGLGYEIQISESFFIQLKTNKITDKNLILWIKHIKKEDSDSLYGFVSKDEKDFFVEILNIKGIGSQIGMSLLNKYSPNEIINAIEAIDNKLISSVAGIGQKMTDRLMLELKSNLSLKLKSKGIKIESVFQGDKVEIVSMFEDIDLTLQSLNYSKKEIKAVFPMLIRETESRKDLIDGEKKVSFEKLLKLAMNYLDKNNSKLDL